MAWSATLPWPAAVGRARPAYVLGVTLLHAFYLGNEVVAIRVGFDRVDVVVDGAGGFGNS